MSGRFQLGHEKAAPLLSYLLAAIFLIPSLKGNHSRHLSITVLGSIKILIISSPPLTFSPTNFLSNAELQNFSSKRSECPKGTLEMKAGMAGSGSRLLPPRLLFQFRPNPHLLFRHTWLKYRHTTLETCRNIFYSCLVRFVEYHLVWTQNALQEIGNQLLWFVRPT